MIWQSNYAAVRGVNCRIGNCWALIRNTAYELLTNIFIYFCCFFTATAVIAYHFAKYLVNTWSRQWRYSGGREQGPSADFNMVCERLEYISANSLHSKRSFLFLIFSQILIYEILINRTNSNIFYFKFSNEFLIS